MDYNDQHSIETYKSLIAISQFGLRFVLLINGGAAVAVLAFIGDLASSVGMLPDVGKALTWYVLGMALGGIALVTSYLTQLVLFNEAKSEPSPRFLKRHQPWLTLSLVLVVLSVVAFVFGSFEAVAGYEALFSENGS